MSTVAATEVPRTTHAAALALEYGDRVLLGTTRDVHRAVAGRIFAPLRFLGGRVPQAVHDTVSDAVYSGLSSALRGAGGALRGMAVRGVGAPIEEGPGGRRLRAITNGLIGAELHDAGDPSAITMAVRHRDADVPPTARALAEAFPHASDHLVVFLHGLVESDESWSRETHDARGGYPDRIADEVGATPLMLRYNSGLHVSDNGAELAQLVDDVIDAWPVRVSRVDLVGHSMGGLVARAATHHALAQGRAWPGLVRQVVCLGTPHLGANLEKVAHLGGQALGLVPESAPFARILTTRSPGIVDLRHGYVTRDEWDGQDLTAKWGLDRRAVAPLAHADYHFVAGTLGGSTWHPLSLLLGDLLVDVSSAHGRPRRGEPVVAHATTSHVGAAGHFALLDHPQVGDWLVAWLRPRAVAALPATPTTPGGPQ
ncbi:lipase family alpha/beta hydrolase [Solicola sp. PLA-1-18]|uniref:lipase family alpha/beta hydrolase n=1 Tax=Solicola sp. PLA-1-18 TaxID=3380532 RepID=UPI003B7FE8D8